MWYEGTTTTNKTWLYQDQLGSVIGTANSAGTSTAIHSYGPYGEPNIATGIRFRYTGQQFLGSLNLYYYKARFYSPALGRFLQTDPIGTADDLNLYAYVGNNPINFSDPSGLIAAEASMLLGKVGSTSAGQFALGFIPGYDLYSASQNPNASMLDYGIGILGILPGAGKGVGTAIRAGDNLIGAAAKEVGIVAKDGTAITGLTRHGVDRVIGDGAKRAGTKPDAILDAIKNPTKIKEGVDNLDRPFKVYTGENARVVVNPETGKIISTNPLSREGAYLP
ncbi:RHS repeat-associated core domain-containing protein [Nitrosomonas sp.]|uniref:RHS repeat-associated core domain-containing protein n=1 Tax=Nitrosomonas sp. TaxID=42353 RepID=UPI0025D61A0B|nr:RHS repeat-associated core domain-containing protein [Nitrosomonas sp.]